MPKPAEKPTSQRSLLILTADDKSLEYKTIDALAHLKGWSRYTIGGMTHANNIIDDAIWIATIDAVKEMKHQGMILFLDETTFAPNEAGETLRGTTGRERYGKPNLNLQQKDRVRTYSLIAIRAAELAMMAINLNIPLYVETAMLESGKPSTLRLEEFQNIVIKQHVQDYVSGGKSRVCNGPNLNLFSLDKIGKQFNCRFALHYVIDKFTTYKG